MFRKMFIFSWFRRVRLEVNSEKMRVKEIKLEKESELLKKKETERSHVKNNAYEY